MIARSHAAIIAASCSLAALVLGLTVGAGAGFHGARHMECESRMVFSQDLDCGNGHIHRFRDRGDLQFSGPGWSTNVNPGYGTPVAPDPGFSYDRDEFDGRQYMVPGQQSGQDAQRDERNQQQRDDQDGGSSSEHDKAGKQDEKQ
jgi:hypothetical protein